MDRNDELIALANQRATQEALGQIQRDMDGTARCYEQALQEGKSDEAGWQLRNYKALADEAQSIAAGAQRAQQAQGGLTPKQQQVLDAYPSIRNDPQKWAQAQYFDASLKWRGYDPNSDAYVNAMLLGLGVRDADGGEALEIASPDEALRVSQSKYGAVSADEYNQGVARLAEMKKYGFYKAE